MPIDDLPSPQFYTPLMHACEGGPVEMVGLLLDSGAKMDHVGGQFSVRRGHVKV